MSEHEEWVCPHCGTRNSDQFCENCGAPRPAAPQPAPAEERVSDETQVLPGMPAAEGNPSVGGPDSAGPEAVPPLPPSPPLQAPPAASPKNRTMKILGGVAIVLLLAVIGVFAYMSGAEDRYVKKAMEAEQVTMDARELVLDIKSMKGDPDSDQDKDFIERVHKAKGNLEKLSGDLKSIHTGSKYQAVNKDLVEAVMLEKSIFDDVETVLKEPTGEDAGKAVGRVKDQIQELKDRGAKLQIGAADFTDAMDLTGLDQQLTGYVRKRQAAEAAARARAQAEAAAKAKAEAEARARVLQQKRAKRTQEEIDAATDVDYIATDLQVVNGNQLRFDGFFLNKTSHPIVSVNSFELEVQLYKNGDVVYPGTGQFRRQVTNGLLYPNQRQGRRLSINTNDKIPDFDDFRVSTSDARWTYRQ